MLASTCLMNRSLFIGNFLASDDPRRTETSGQKWTGISFSTTPNVVSNAIAPGRSHGRKYSDRANATIAQPARADRLKGYLIGRAEKADLKHSAVTA